MKLKFEDPNIEIISFNEADVITASTTFTTNGIYGDTWNIFKVDTNGE